MSIHGFDRLEISAKIIPETVAMQICKVMQANAEKMAPIIQEAIEQSLADIDLKQFVRTTADKAIRSEVESYFKFGPGRSAITEAIRKQFQE